MLCSSDRRRIPKNARNEPKRVSSFYSPPPGALYDATESYDSSFILATCCFTLASLSLFLEPYASRYVERKKKNSSGSSSSASSSSGSSTSGKRSSDRHDDEIAITQSQTINILKAELHEQV